MSNVVKERITDDLQKARAEGNLRAERIREIVKAAVSQAVTEIKGGSGEIRGIAKDAVLAVVDFLKERGKTVQDDVAASIEGVVEGIRTSQEDAIAKSQAQVDQLQAEVDAQTQTLEAEVDGALVEIETSAKQSSADFKSLIDAAIHTIRESKQFAQLQDQYVKLRARLAVFDERLAERYGDRYEQVKHQLEKYLENTKAWYSTTKAKVEAGTPDPVQKMQVELGIKMSEAGAAVAKKEQELKQHLKEMLHKEP
ncbi:MAG: histidine kinase [Leptolyngbyaceae cyanobacterium RU_5_1]|nr:histidine kinase [Leptolyngbyaceae cyanobacterium RU_5_1]